MKLTVEKLRQRIDELGKHLHRSTHDVVDVRLIPLETPGVMSSDFDASGFPTVSRGQTWASPDQTVWLRTAFSPPDDTDREGLFLQVRLGQDANLAGPEALLYLDGCEYQGIDRFHTLVPLPPGTAPGHTFIAAIRTYAPKRLPAPTFGGAEVVVIDQAAEGLYWDATVALGSALEMSQDSPARAFTIEAVDEAFKKVDFRMPASDAFFAGMTAARERLRELLDRIPGGQFGAQVTLVGHAHIDVAWLWPLEQTRWKCGRTFSTVLRLMEQYPEYHFVQSQAQLYDYTRERFPNLYEQIRQRVAEGRWEPIGGMWVECDCNITGGESLVRQFALGKRFFRSQFGVDSSVVWLPDVFGYSWSLPQIAAKCGMKYFMTTKISWNRYNKLPHDTFRWRGVDGTELLAHFITTPSGDWFATYNARTDPQSVFGAWKAYKDKALSTEVLIAFGYGDGGGGPTREMLQQARRYDTTPNTPAVRMDSAEAFFARLEGARDETAVWEDELYLELHRGTYTSQSRTKRANRLAESALHNAELFSAYAALDGEDYPSEVLEEAWKLVLLNQFHDILPGSSVTEVYEESARQYEQATAAARDAAAEAMRGLAGRLDTGDCERAFAVFNPGPFKRTDVAAATLKTDGRPFEITNPEGEAVPCQVADRAGDISQVVFEAADVPAFGARVFKLRRTDVAPSFTGEVTGSEGVLENKFFKVRFDNSGRIRSVFDKSTSREVIPPGRRANVFEAFEDLPVNFDAWDVEIYFEEKPVPPSEPVSMKVVENGPVRAAMEVVLPLGESTITQRVYLYDAVARIDFETVVDWRERHTLLKVAFPVDIHASFSTQDIQFANIQRPNRRNTSWEAAKFETCAQKWIDLSEGDYGVSLLNDCKYGCDVRDNVLRLSLLRSPTTPDPEADQGEHRFTYALLPHAGDWRTATIPEAYALNLPLIATEAPVGNKGGSDEIALLAVDSPNLIVETVKQAFDGPETVVRVYEAHNRRGTGMLTFEREIADAFECDLMEENRRAMKFAEGRLKFRYAPYEIKTFLLTFK